MAGRINASGESFRRTANLPSRTAFTIAGWGYRHTAQAGTYRYFAGLEDATSNSSGYLLLGWAADNTLGLTSDGGTQGFGGGGPAAGGWFYWFIRSNGSNSYQAGYKPSGGSWTTVTLTATLNWTPAMLTLGNDSYDEWTDIGLERVRCWDAALTNAELDSEAANGTPVRTSNLRANWPLVSDTSETANSYSLTAVGSVSYESGPPGMGGGGVSVTPAAAAAAAGAVSPTVVRGTVSVTPAVAGATAGAVAPSVVLGAAVTVTPGAAGAVATAVTPVVVRGAVAVAPGTASAAASTSFVLLCGATTGGVLEVDPVNGRYFRNDSGPLVLAGFHTWASIQDSWPSLPITPMDFDEYLDALVAYGCNFTKAWFLESAKDWGDSVQYFSPHPWPRTGPGSAADGLPKFDLSQFNEEYFARLRERCIRLGNAGIYVCVQLFQGWHVAQKGLTTGDPWAYHPMAAANNINSIDGDTNDDGSGYETRSTSFTAVYNLQKAYVERVIDTLNDLDNIFWEIANEEDSSSLTWQRALVDYIQTYEASKAKQHPVGMTVCWPGGDNADLYATGAIDWLSPNGDYTPDAASTAKVSAFDTDHITGLTAEYKWIFRALCQGHNPWYMDEWAGETYGSDRRSNATYQRIRANLGYALSVAAQVDLANATPQPSLASTGYCLAKTSGRYQLVAYQDTSGAFTVNLTSLPGTFSVEWLRTLDGATQAGANVSGGAVRTLTPPWAGEDAVALLELFGVTVAPAAAAGAAGAIAPAVVLGAITLAPGAAGAVGGAIAPVVILGSIVITPEAAAGAGAAVAPVVVLGAVTVVPGPAESAAGAIAPAVVIGGGAIVPAVAVAVAVAVAPTVILGAVTVVPDAAASAAGAGAPTVQQGTPVLVAPGFAAAVAVAVTPAVAMGAIALVPDTAASGAEAGGVVVILGAVTAVPAPAGAAAGAQLGTVQEGAAVTVAPDAAAAVSGADAPVVVLGSVTVTPAPATASAGAPGPGVLVGIILAAVTLHSQRSLMLVSDRNFVLTFRR